MKKSLNLQEQANLLLKNIELQTVLHEYDGDIDAEYLPEAKQDAIKAVAAYKRRQDEIALYFPLSEIVYHFLGGHFYEDNFSNYKNVAVKLLVAMSDLEFNKKFEEKIGGYCHSHLVKMLYQLLGFMESLQAKSIEPLLLIHDLKNRDYTDENLLQIKEEYEERLRVSLAGKYKHT